MRILVDKVIGLELSRAQIGEIICFKARELVLGWLIGVPKIQLQRRFSGSKALVWGGTISQ
jgi:hypothetical protein